MSCTKCFKTKDAQGNPISHCTGMCNVIVLAISEAIKKMKPKITATLASILLVAQLSAQEPFKVPTYNTNPNARDYVASLEKSYIPEYRPIEPYRNTRIETHYLEFGRFYVPAEIDDSTFAVITFNDRIMTVTIDDVRVVYDVISLKKSNVGRGIIRIDTYAEKVKDERVRPRYTWYYIPDDDRFVNSTTGMRFYN